VFLYNFDLFVSRSESNLILIDPTLVAPTATREKKPCSHSPSDAYSPGCGAMEAVVISWGKVEDTLVELVAWSQL